ncbi:MAG TPA: cyanophycin synthetase [Candidatus Limnocylindrales bacterium]
MSPTRGAAAVGSGLSPARDARPIREGERIHVVGAGGAGASAAALLANDGGATVSGCDRGGPSPYTPPLEAAGIHLDWTHDPSHLTRGPAPERLAVTKALTAVDPNNPELAAARTTSIPLEPWQQVIADAAVGRLLVGVAGTHGKSTTAGWLVHILVEAGLDPSAFVGALLPGSITGGLPSTARTGTGMPFVVEADEYAGNFDAYRPNVAVLTSAEWDHPDVFADTEAVIAAFTAWLWKAQSGPHPPILVANVADPGVAAVVERLSGWPGLVCAVSLAGDNRALLDAVRREELSARFRTAGGPAQVLLGRIARAGQDGTLLEFAGVGTERAILASRIRLAGRHNAANALCVAGAAFQLSVPGDRIVSGLGSFGGVGRRLERKGEERGVVVYDDYGHHPTAIRETLAALRQLEPGRRIWAVYEPLTYHRTAAMLHQFAEVLATADAVAVADIWASRDPDTSITSAAALAEATARLRPGLTAVAPGSVERTAAWLANEVRAGDAVLVMGGGRSYRIAELLLEALAG